MRDRPYIAKITAPQFGNAVERTRLYKIAKEAREKQILWVNGPAGSGKTTFVGSCLTQARVPTMMTNGCAPEVIRWIRALPESLIKQRPWLQVRLGIALLFVEPLVSRQLLTEAFYRFKSEQEIAGMITAWNGIIETTLAEFTTYLHLPPWIKEMEELLERSSPLASKELEALVAYGMFSACFRNGVPDKRFCTWSARADRAALSQCNVALRIRIAWLLAIYRDVHRRL